MQRLTRLTRNDAAQSKNPTASRETALQRWFDRTARASSPGNGDVAQLKKAVPNYTAGAQATAVSLTLDKGDTLDGGSAPRAALVGWDEILALGLTGGGDDDHRWIKFHVLNQKAGGSGATKNNLVPATQTANHHADWNALEKALKLWVDPEHSYGTGAPAAATFLAKVGYYGADKNATWTKDGKDVDVSGAHYPSSVEAMLIAKTDSAHEGGGAGKEYKTTAALDGTKGLLAPPQFTPAGWTKK